jgi:aldehyde dehydrogenase (NAD+)
MEYSKESIHDIVLAQRKFFRTGKPLDVEWRIRQLLRLKQALLDNKKQLQDALYEDLRKSPMEAYLVDIGPVIVEINELVKGLRKWAKPEKHFNGFMCFPSTETKVYKMPYGVSLIISPFNFPVILTLGVLAASICGGNTAVIKASSKSAATTEALRKLIADTFPEKYATVIGGGHDVADICLEERFDKIFYTGSPQVARHVMEKASNNLTSVALELGGETGNWAIVRKDANLKDTARKIAFFKLCNAGQICININQIAVAEEVAEKFLEELKKQFVKQIGKNASDNPDYPKLITSKVYDKCEKIASDYSEKIVFGGTGNKEECKFSPTIIYPVSPDDDLVQHELFSPILPVVPFKDSEVDNILEIIADREHPLAMYIFTSDIKWADRVMATQQYGGGCINEVCLHMMVKGVPFNGTGHSGMGAYHGEWGFREFTHPQTVLKGSTRFNLPLREHPYSGVKGKMKMALLKVFEK